MMQLLSLTKQFLKSKSQLLVRYFIREVKGCNIQILRVMMYCCFDDSHLDELKVSHDDNICNLIHK